MTEQNLLLQQLHELGRQLEILATIAARCEKDAARWHCVTRGNGYDALTAAYFNGTPDGIDAAVDRVINTTEPAE